MSFSLKVAATLGLTAGATVAMMELAIQAAAAQSQSPGLTGNPVVDGLIGGGTVTAIALAVFKTRLDRVERDIEKKADVGTIDDIRKDIREIRNHLMGEK